MDISFDEINQDWPETLKKEREQHGEQASILQPSFLAIHPQIRREALPIFYAENKFHISAIIESSGQILIHGLSRDVTGTKNIAASDFKGKLDAHLRFFNEANGVDQGSRLAHIREIKCTIEYVHYQDGFLATSTFQLSMSANTKWGETEPDDPDELEACGEEDEDEDATVGFRRKKVHKLIKKARKTMTTVLDDSGQRKLVRSKVFRAPPENYGMDAIVSFAKYCPLATKSVTIKKFDTVI